MKKIIYSFIFLFFIFFFNTIIFAHEHTNGCYSTVENHNHIGDEINGGECFNTPIYHTHTDKCYEQVCENNTGYLEFNRTMLCTNPSCDFYNYENEKMFVSENDKVQVYKRICDVCNQSSEYAVCHICNTTIIDEQISHSSILTCNQDGQIEKYKLSCNKSSSNSLICNTTIVSIQPLNYMQVGTLDETIIVTYLDEHTEQVKATNNNYDKNKTYNGENIILSYNDFSTTVSFYSLSTNAPINNITNNDNNGASEIELVEVDEKDLNNNIEFEEKEQINLEQKETLNLDVEKQELEIKDTIIEELDEEIKYEEKPQKNSNSSFVTILIISIPIIVICMLFVIILKNKNKK